MSKKVYKCCWNCAGGMKGFVPSKTKANDEYFDRCVKLNEHQRFCGMNNRNSQYAYDAFKQRFCKNFEERQIIFDEPIITKEEAVEKQKTYGISYP